MQVGGSNLVKQQEQLGTSSIDVTTLFDFCFSENGLTAFRLGKSLASNNFIQWLGEDKYQALVDFVLKFIANTKLPRKRGTFIEFRNGMVNISPVGRAASHDERNEFEAYVHS
jgi:phosphomannomutase